MHSTEGVILKKIDVGEVDSLFTIYTKDFGKIRARAQGIKKEGAKLRGHLEILSHANISFVLGKNGERLTGATLLNFWSGIRGDFSKTAVACFAADLIDKNCLNGEKDKTLWDFLIEALHDLENAKLGRDGANEFLNNFEKRFSETQGYAGGRIRDWAISSMRPFGL